MLKYNGIEQLVSDMFHTVEIDEDIVSVIANKDLVIEIMQEMLTYDNVKIDRLNIDSFVYDKEYFISLYYDDDDECWYICADQSYIYDTGKYVAMGGYILFHEDVNSKALVDIQNNEMSFLTGHDFFVIGEDDSFETDDEDVSDEEAELSEKEDVVSNQVSYSKSVFRINGKEVDKETYDKESTEFDLLLYDIFKNTINEFKPMHLRFFW